MRLDERIEAGFGPAPAAPAPPPPPGCRAPPGGYETPARPPQPRSEAAPTGSLGQHPNTVREHLDALVEAGLASRERAASTGRGRPAWLYAALPVTGAGEYAGLARALARHLARSSARPQEEAREAGREWGAQLAAERSQGERVSTAAARRSVVDLLDGLGFAPEGDRRAERVRLRRCPLLDAALEHPDVVCGVHLGIAEGALEAWGASSEATRLVPFAEPGACLLHLAAPADDRAARPTAPRRAPR